MISIAMSSIFNSTGAKQGEFYKLLSNDVCIFVMDSNYVRPHFQFGEIALH